MCLLGTPYNSVDHFGDFMGVWSKDFTLLKRFDFSCNQHISYLLLILIPGNHNYLAGP